MSKQEFNPLDGWTKKQIADALKTHSKKELLKIAMQWRIAAENYMKQLESNNDDITTENTTHGADS